MASRPGVGSAWFVRQRQELEFNRLYVEQPLLISVVDGTKVIRLSGGEHVVRRGESIAVAGRQSVDVINKVGDDGRYRALCIALDDVLVAEYAEANSLLAPIRYAHPLSSCAVQFQAAMNRAIQVLEDQTLPVLITAHTVKELLLWVAISGKRFECSRLPTLSVKVRQLICKDLGQAWSAPFVARAFAMSESTLRRKLADEGTSLSDLLVDARMSFALQLLQSTAWPVLEIALTVGYQTPSQFAVRFRDRFGFPPTAVRGHRYAVLR